MKKRKNYILITFVILILFPLIFISCSNSNYTSPPATCSLSGSTYSLKQFNCQYDYLDTLGHQSYIFPNKVFEKVSSAFDKAQISLCINTSSPHHIDTCFRTIDNASDAIFKSAADMYYANHYGGKPNWYQDGIIIGIDSAHNTLDTGQSNFTWLAISQPGTYSMVFVDKILNKNHSWSYQVDTDAVLAVATHELGHQLNIIICGPDNHGGCGWENCVMDRPLHSEQYDLSNGYGGIHFCEFHMDTIWNNAFSSTYSLSGNSASKKSFKFPIKDSKNVNFSYSISMLKDTYLECEPIHVILKIKNLRNVNDSLPIIDYEDFSVFNEGNNKNLYPRHAVTYGKIPYVHFSSDEEKTYDFEIVWEFGNESLVTDENQYKECYYISSGRYSISAGKQKISSNKLTFSVVKPEGQDLEELNEFGTTFIKLDGRYRIDKLYNFLTKYPDSKYFELALRIYEFEISYYTSEDYINLVTFANKWFEKDTESEFVEELIKSFCYVYETSYTEAKDKITDYLNKIVSEHPDSNISKWFNEYSKLFKNLNKN